MKTMPRKRTKDPPPNQLKTQNRNAKYNAPYKFKTQKSIFQFWGTLETLSRTKRRTGEAKKEPARMERERYASNIWMIKKETHMSIKTTTRTNGAKNT